jgi:flavin reductase (DIM6/NTAB) family NADH-FMN oxidoreductase RutF
VGVVVPLARSVEAAATSLPVGEQVRDAMARLASGLTLITCWADGVPKGLIATSLVGLSVAPARLLFSVRHEASAHDALIEGGRCAAVVLSEDDLPVARRFSAPDVHGERFASPDWRLDDDFAPRFEGGLARFDLRIEHKIGAETHTIFIAEALEVSSRPGAPLLYYERAFAGLAQAASS